MQSRVSPLSSIEKIAVSADRTQAIVFFLFFSRFEYALKRAGWLAARDAAEADWPRYAREGPNLIFESRGKSFLDAVEYLKSSPPKRQRVTDGRLVWEDDLFHGTPDLARIFTLVGRVRNNLFHGGKFPEGPQTDISRNRRLLEAALAIMQGCLDADERLRQFFLEDLA